MSVTRRYFACAVTIVLTVAGFVTHAAGPARAAITSAQANVVVRNSNGTYQAFSYSLAAGDGFATNNVAEIARATWSHPGFNDSWQLDIAAPARTRVVPGVYELARDFSTVEAFRPLLNLYSGMYCPQSKGRFVVHDVEYTFSEITKLDVYFEQDCGSTSAIGRVVIGLPLPDAAAAGGPSVQLTASAPTDPAVVRVFAQAPAGVQSITARIINPETGQEVGRTNTFTRETGTDTLGTWTGVHLDAVGAPGFYRIDTDIVDRNGTSVSQSRVGYLAHAARAEFTTPELDRDHVDFRNRKAKIRGVLAARQPGTNQTRPIAGADLTVWREAYLCSCDDERFAKVVGTGVTTQDGSFEIDLSVEHDENIFVVYQGDPATYIGGGESGKVRITLNQTAAKISGPSADFGRGPISGTVGYSLGARDADIALPDTEIEVIDCDARAFCWPLLTTRTDAQGRYSFNAGAKPGGYLKIVAKPADPFLTRAEWYVQPAAYDPSVNIVDFGGYWLSDQVARLIGEITLSGSAASTVPIAIQIQTDSGWKTVVSASAIEYVEGWFFQATVGAPCGTSYWRAAYGPNDEAASDVLRAVRGCMVLRPLPSGGGGGTLPPQR